ISTKHVAAAQLPESYAYRSRESPHNYFTVFFSLSYEENLPTWYSSSILLICAGLLAAIAIVLRRKEGTVKRHWWILCALFVYVSLDETATIHEHLSGIFHTGGVLYYDWVIPAGIFVLVMGLYFLPFVLSLPPRTRNKFIVAGSIYVGGALLMELPLGWWADNHDTDNLTYALIDILEEGMEILGLSLFLVALAEFLADTLQNPVKKQPAAPPAG
ncbi:MAG: hypothetical protein HKO57_08740, partial [Akkermansiaceae bacterium]|nr:hypothetical protein [Akkermansiaceae bacterium]